MKKINFFNTFTGEKEEFKPLHIGKVGLYTCGPTVYDYAHIGNFRAYIFEDLLRRFLEYCSLEVTQIMNITDVDDKTIAGAQEAGLGLEEFTEKYTKAFFEDLDSLRIQRAQEFPRATECVPEMLEIVDQLVAKGHAYESKGSVYFRIQSFDDYGKLSKKKLDANIKGARIDSDEYEKDDASDFVLWKGAKEGEPSWPSKFGDGRPGWHIECSAMSMKYLGSHFDIHTGGEDNIFPHHENEIAQSVCATDNAFVNYWLHCRFLLVDGEKMSKSKGNFYTLRDLLEKGYDPISIRYLLLSHHYRHPLNFTLEGIEQAKKAIDRINEFIRRMSEMRPDKKVEENLAFHQQIDDAHERFENALADDLNSSEALGVLFDFMKMVNHQADQSGMDVKALVKIDEFIQMIDKILDIRKEVDRAVPPDIQLLIERREEARKEKNFDEADKIRDELTELGWHVKDTKNGIKIVKIL